MGKELIVCLLYVRKSTEQFVYILLSNHISKSTVGSGRTLTGYSPVQRPSRGMKEKESRSNN